MVIIEAVEIVERVEMIETGINLTTNRDVVLKNHAASPRPKAEDWEPGFLRPHRDW